MSHIHQLLDELTKLHPKVIDLSLERLQALLKRLGNPHQKLPPIIHIAGTNGKGSTQAFLKAILQAHGKKVHAYTSPHLVHFNERIELCGQAISNDDLSKLILEVQAKNNGEPITFFEVTTAIAFLAFSRIKADYLLLEVGLGGRFDATNVVEQSLATAITPISVDHQEFLGSDIVKIASEKAGIFKKDTPSYWAWQQKNVYAELVHQAQQAQCPYKYETMDWSITDNIWQMDEASLCLKDLSLKGQHQQQNAALALSLLHDILGAEFSIQKAKKALKDTIWPARLQNIKEGYYKEIIPQHDLWLDGAHNPHGAQILAQYVKENWTNKPVYLILGMLNNRDVSQWLIPFDGLITEALSLPLTSTPNGHKPGFLKEVLNQHHIKSTAFSDMRSAFKYLSDKPEAYVLMAGSLYMIGSFLEQN
ncbi:MAG: bifunctional folylpolyglutamate synthase/dihydrofolate synthase [Alphaproteobacteria bacterium]